jgi:hypothetical protein
MVRPTFEEVCEYGEPEVEHFAPLTEDDLLDLHYGTRSVDDGEDDEPSDAERTVFADERRAEDRAVLEADEAFAAEHDVPAPVAERVSA